MPSPPVFIVGCGRSGTTFFGRTLAKNANVIYFEEPRARWHLIDERTDEIGLFGCTGTLCLTASDVTTRNLAYLHLFFPKTRRANPSIIIDKTPANVFRLQWLAALYPDAKFVNIVRDGNKVIPSILRRCKAPRYRVSWSEFSNQWWGRNECKKNMLNRLADQSEIKVIANGKFNDTEFAALEWMLSIWSANQFKRNFSNQILDVNFDIFLNKPEKQLDRVSSFLNVPCKSEMIDFVLSKNTRYFEKQTVPSIAFSRQDIRTHYNNMRFAFNEQSSGEK